jgi:alpha-beta hydrolase superfamily lysophospholipase
MGRLGNVIGLFLFGLAACAPVVLPERSERATPAVGDDHLVVDDGARLPLAEWQPDGSAWAVALAVHGFNDYRAAFADMGRRMAERGVRVYAYDQRGFGAAPGRGYWPGNRRLQRDLQSAIGALRARHPDLPLYLVGESMGGAVVMTALANAPAIPVDGAVLIAPAVWGVSTMNPVQSGALWLLAHTVPWFPLTARGLPISPSDNVEMLRRYSADPLVIKDSRTDAVYGLVGLMDEALFAAPQLRRRLFVVYGGRDEIVPRAPTCRMLRSLPNSGDAAWRIAIYPDGHHMITRDLDGARVIDDILAWMAAPDGDLPSGIATAGPSAPAVGVDALCRGF